MISVTLIDHAEPVQLDIPEAAQLMVEQYGERVYDIPVSALRSEFNAYWATVDHLIESRRGA